MRITNGMLIKNMLWGINNNLTKLEKAQTQITSGTQLQAASDDPVKAARILKMRNYVSEVEQMQKNAEDAVSWLEFCDSALKSLGEAVTDIDELTTQAANGTYSEEDLAAIKAEITELKNGIIDLGNSSYNGRYVFAGFDTDKAPLEVVTTLIGDMITYRGSYLSLGGAISASVSDADIEEFVKNNYADSVTGAAEKQGMFYKVGQSNKVCINAEGNEIFGQEGSSIFDTLAKLEMALAGETSYKTAVYSEGPPESVTIETHDLSITGLLDDLAEDSSRILNARTGLGAKTSYIELVQSRLSSNYVTFTALLSKNEDTDYAEAAINLSAANTVYNASLSVGAKVIMNSLLDFIG